MALAIHYTMIGISAQPPTVTSSILLIVVYIPIYVSINWGSEVPAYVTYILLSSRRFEAALAFYSRGILTTFGLNIDLGY